MEVFIRGYRHASTLAAPTKELNLNRIGDSAISRLNLMEERRNVLLETQLPRKMARRKQRGALRRFQFLNAEEESKKGLGRKLDFIQYTG